MHEDHEELPPGIFGHVVPTEEQCSKNCQLCSGYGSGSAMQWRSGNGYELGSDAPSWLVAA